MEALTINIIGFIQRFNLNGVAERGKVERAAFNGSVLQISNPLSSLPLGLSFALCVGGLICQLRLTLAPSKLSCRQGGLSVLEGKVFKEQSLSVFPGVPFVRFP